MNKPLKDLTEDNFFKIFESWYPSWEKDNWFLSDYLHIVSFDNIFPQDKIVPKQGGWIKTPSKNGFSIHFAKNAVRVDKYFLMRRIEANNKIIEKINEENDIQLKNELLSLNVLFQLCLFFEVVPYFIKVQKTLSKYEYLLPYQYELLHGEIDMYIDMVREKTKHITYKTISNNYQQDVVFYLQSRGISKDEAILLANIKNIKFDVNLVKMFSQHEKV